MKLFKKLKNVPLDFTGVCKTTDDNSIYYFKDGDFHKEDGPAVEFENGFKQWYYKDGCHGINDDFTIDTWLEKVEELKREEELKIFV